MTFLYIDSTYDISLGVLDKDLGWKFFNTFIGQKASSVLQKETHLQLSHLGLKISDLKGVITVAGPGFYTGLRLSEGFADVLKFNGLNHYSFYTHKIPYYLNFDEGVWLTKAYRGEYFFHHWNNQGTRDELITLKDLDTYFEKIKGVSLFIHSESAIDDHLKKYQKSFISTRSLLEENPQFILNEIIKTSSKVESFYFRAPEDEFKANP